MAKKVNASLKAWVAFVKKVQKQYKLSYKDAIHKAKELKDKGADWTNKSVKLKGGSPMDSDMDVEVEEKMPDMDVEVEEKMPDMDVEVEEKMPDMDVEVEEDMLTGGRRRKGRRTRKRRGSRRKVMGRSMRRRAARRTRSASRSRSMVLGVA